MATHCRLAPTFSGETIESSTGDATGVSDLPRTAAVFWKRGCGILTLLVAPSLLGATPPATMEGGAALVEVVATGGSDWDFDGLEAETERALGLKPRQADTDGDGQPDGWEVWNGLDALDAGDAFLDADGDGLCNVDEFAAGTLPSEPDTDGDLYWDGLECERGTDAAAAWSFPSSAVLGDVDCDGRVNSVDLQMVINGVLGMPVPAPANVDLVSQLDAMDIQYVVNVLHGGHVSM